MKTAIQELIEKIQYSIDVQSRVSLTETQVNTLKAVMLIAETLLELEKEQIVDAYRIASINNAPNEDMQNIKPEYWQVNAQMWYDKYYNQNK